MNGYIHTTKYSGAPKKNETPGCVRERGRVQNKAASVCCCAWENGTEPCRWTRSRADVHAHVRVPCRWKTRQVLTAQGPGGTGGRAPHPVHEPVNAEVRPT